MQSSFATSLFEHKAWCNRGLIAALRAAPAEVDPGPMAVIRLTLDHTSIVDRIFRSRLIGEEVELSSIVAPKVPDLDRLGATLEEVDSWYLHFVANVSSAELDATVSFVFVADGETGAMTRGQMLAHVITHGASHRAEIHNRLKRLGVAGAPDGMVTTFYRM